MSADTEQHRAVVIEDDLDIRGLLVLILKRLDFEVIEANTGIDGIEAVRSTQADLVTLDLNLPDLDGLEVCRRLREFSDAYIMMLTARTDETNRLNGLDLGADDYVTKPFSPKEIQARVQAMFRHSRGPFPVSGDDSTTIDVEPSIRLDPDPGIDTKGA